MKGASIGEGGQLGNRPDSIVQASDPSSAGARHPDDSPAVWRVGHAAVEIAAAAMRAGEGVKVSQDGQVMRLGHDARGSPERVSERNGVKVGDF